jgi:hypothetical protein
MTMVEIVARLKSEQSLLGVAGCSWWTGSKVFHEAPRASMHDLSAFASPYLTGWIPETMFDRWDHNGKNLEGTFGRAFLETYRRCYMQCSYCQWGNGSKSRFAFPKARVLDELSWLLSRRIRSIWIVDAMFGFKKEHAKELLRHIIREKRRYEVDTNIVCYHNQDFYDTELFDLYREANVSVEVDLQSTSKDVLTAVGRAKWYIDSFDKHLAAFKEHKVPTTGGADLIIGLPLDNESTFADSVDFLLRRGMHVNLYQTSIIPDTPMSKAIAENGIIHSEIAPRAVFKNSTFPVSQMVRARLIGHGVDFFRRYPKTANLLWRHKFARPVDLCKHIGELVWKRFALMYGESHILDAVLADKQEMLGELLHELCTDEHLLPILRELFQFEAAASILCFPPQGIRISMVRPLLQSLPSDASWLRAVPSYYREAIREVNTKYDIAEIVEKWEVYSQKPLGELHRNVAEKPATCLVYSTGTRKVNFVAIHSELVTDLLHRFNGYFTVAECLDNLTSQWRGQDLSPLWSRLAWLGRSGLLEPGMSSDAGTLIQAVGETVCVGTNSQERPIAN